MKRIRPLLKKGVSILQRQKYARIAARHKYISLVALLVLITAVSTTTLLVLGSSARNDAQKTATITSPKTDTTSTVQEATPQSATSTSVNTPTNQQPNPTNTNTQAAAPKSSSGSTQKSLIIIPSSFTIKAGENPPISVRSNDGKGINMPMFSASGGKFFFNFPAGPAKANWIGNLITSSSTAVGSYTYEIFAQDNSQAYYKGTITINIVKPTMNITVQSLGYDNQDDAVGYIIKIDRLYGFSEGVSEVAAYSTTEPGLGCYYQAVDNDTIAMACGHEDGVRPTTGTLSITVTTASLSRSTSTTYSLPPSP